MKWFCQIISVLLYPMFLPTYAISLYALAMRNALVPTRFWVLVISATFFFTCFIPLTTSLLLLRRKKVSDLMMEDRRERRLPYLYSILSMVIWVLFCFKIEQIVHWPMWICYMSIAATVLLTIVFIINFWWKISIHLTTMGAFVGSIIIYAWATHIVPIIAFPCMLILTMLLMMARLYLKAHTPAQVIAGFFLGFLIMISLIPFV